MQGFTPTSPFRAEWRRALVAGLSAFLPARLNAGLGALAGLALIVFLYPFRFATGCILVDLCAVLTDRVAPCAAYTAFSAWTWIVAAVLCAATGAVFGALRAVARRAGWGVTLGRLRVGPEALYALVAGYALGLGGARLVAPPIHSASATIILILSGPLVLSIWSGLHARLVLRAGRDRADAGLLGLRAFLSNRYGLRLAEVTTDAGPKRLIEVKGPFDPADEARIRDLLARAFIRDMALRVTSTASPEALARYEALLGPSGHPPRRPGPDLAPMALLILITALSGTIFAASRLGLYDPLTPASLKGFYTRGASASSTCATSTDTMRAVLEGRRSSR